MRRLLTGLLLASLLGACTRDGDPGYTALMRYQVTDFRVAGISAEPADPEATLPLMPGATVKLRAVILSASDEPVELEWLDCPSYAYGSVDALLTSVDCLGTPSEKRLGRGETTEYTYQLMPLPPMPWEVDGGPTLTDAGELLGPDGGPWRPEPDEEPREVDPTPFDDATVFLRASRGDKIRYGRKLFAGLFGDQPQPWLDAVQIDGEARAVDSDAVIRRRPGEAIAIRLTLVGATENRPVQWFVSDGTLGKRGLTLYDEVGLRSTPHGDLPELVASNTWTLPLGLGTQELVAVLGGGFATLPHLRLRVEVQP